MNLNNVVLLICCTYSLLEMSVEGLSKVVMTGAGIRVGGEIVAVYAWMKPQHCIGKRLFLNERWVIS